MKLSDCCMQGGCGNRRVGTHYCSKACRDLAWSQVPAEAKPDYSDGAEMREFAESVKPKRYAVVVTRCTHCGHTFTSSWEVEADTTLREHERHLGMRCHAHCEACNHMEPDWVCTPLGTTDKLIELEPWVEEPVDTKAELLTKLGFCGQTSRIQNLTRWVKENL